MKYAFIALCVCASMLKAGAQLIAPEVFKTSVGKVSIQPVLHATMVITVKGKTIYVDPSGGTALFKGLASPDVILITDIHGDHFDIKTLDSVKTPGTTVIVPQAVADKMPEADKKGLVILNNGSKTQQAGVEILAIPMYNLPESPTAMHTKGRGNGYVLTIGGKNFYIAGDTQGIPEMRALKNIDVAFVCMNLPYTMTVNEAADAVLAFKPKIVYPYHYRGKDGFSDVNAFKTLVDAGNKGIEVRLRNWYAVK